MAYTLGNKCAKNLCKRIVLLQLIIENVVTCFLEHTVVDPSAAEFRRRRQPAPCRAAAAGKVSRRRQPNFGRRAGAPAGFGSRQPEKWRRRG